ncbi:hypothetical protein POM88_035823 [Heracleum sosnowskyi]|uniref:DUF4283 domain-containing protein n=1 Tax=Heracleum sosnowskyi TaxID=360622 RepID=A0AAD8HN56_9APIA|nr:hypothetical protein POM88_035823 [Heracleum sosnowskyi]
MGSQDSNVNSAGVPLDHDGATLEFGLDGFVLPFEVADDVLHSHLAVDVDAPQVSSVPSSSGGIPVEENLEVSSEEEGFFHEDDRAKLERESVNRAAKAAFSVNREERNELIALRLKYQEMQRMLAKKGISLVELEKEALNERVEFNSGLSDSSKFINGRDEFGLPVFSKQKIDHTEALGVSGVKDAHNVLEDLSDSVHVTHKAKNLDSSPDARVVHRNALEEKNEVAETADSPKATWSQVVKQAPSHINNLSFDYVPRPPGVKIVSPPEEVLRQGNNKFKTCIVGTFTRGAPPFSRVVAFAHNVWDKKGLVHISQKDPRTYIFKFDTIANMHSAMSKGTWYLEAKPMLVHTWGSKVGEKSTMPLWVKFENMPDCYWTREGLSFLGSVIGNPLSADDLTSKLEILPFAKLCVEYKIGDELPNKIEVEVLDPITEMKHLEEVKVSYPIKPLVCSACKSLGHVIGACPNVSRQWVRKDTPPVPSKVTVDVTVQTQNEPPKASVDNSKQTEKNTMQDAQAVDSKIVDESGSENIKGENDWTTIQARKSKLSPARDSTSNPTTATALKLPIYSALTKSLNKGKNKKARRFGGTRSPSH